MRKMHTFIFDIDISGACNLHCPCCPQGNIETYRLPHGFMEPELLASIVRKATSECRVTGINLFNWTEPLLHPRLPELIHIVQGAGIPCHLSSNLNILPDADAIMAAGPASFKISVSGFTQDVYGTTHRGGNIARVKNNMVTLAEAKKRTGAATRIFVTYHRYRHNLKEEPMMRDFADRLGFGFDPVWALMFPLEKVLAYADGDIQDFPLTEEDHTVIDSLAFPLRNTLAAARNYQNQPCRLRDRQVSLDFQGNVLLCCGIFDAREFSLGNYLALPLDTIQKLRQNHRMCKRCMKNGAHVFLTYCVPEMGRQILDTIDGDDISLLDLRHEIRHKQLCQRINTMSQACLSSMIGDRQKAMLKTVIDQMDRIGAVAKRSLFGKK